MLLRITDFFLASFGLPPSPEPTPPSSSPSSSLVESPHRSPSLPSCSSPASWSPRWPSSSSSKDGLSFVGLTVTRSPSTETTICDVLRA